MHWSCRPSLAARGQNLRHLRRKCASWLSGIRPRMSGEKFRIQLPLGPTER